MLPESLGQDGGFASWAGQLWLVGRIQARGCRLPTSSAEPVFPCLALPSSAVPCQVEAPPAAAGLPVAWGALSSLAWGLPRNSRWASVAHGKWAGSLPCLFQQVEQIDKVLSR